MAHNLNIRRNGVASFASKQEPAWHGLGTVVEAMTSQEALELGGLNFIVEKRPLFIRSSVPVDFEIAKEKDNISRQKIYEGNHGEIVKGYYYENSVVPRQYATVRVDNNLPLGVVGEKYHVIQNYEAFEFIDSIIGEGVADYETVGALGNGETVFITCKLREEMIINKDLIDKYLLITMSHDGSSSINVLFTPIRVVCNNTLTLALKGNINRVTIRHTAKAKDRLEQAKKVLGIVDKQSLAYQEAFGHLLTIKVSDVMAKTIIEESLSLNRDDRGNLSTKATNILQAANSYYQMGVGQEGIVGTGYGVFNGITGYMQNGKKYPDPESKFKNTFLGTSVDVRNKAFDLITNL